MNRRFSFQQYRTIDLILFAVMLVFSEAVIVTAARFWFPDQLYTVSVVAAVTAIVMMRWGPWAAIHAVVGGAVFCFVSGASAGQFIIYCIGNLGSLASLLLIRLWGKEAIRQDVFRSLAFAIATQLGMQVAAALWPWHWATSCPAAWALSPRMFFRASSPRSSSGSPGGSMGYLKIKSIIFSVSMERRKKEELDESKSGRFSHLRPSDGFVPQ